MSSKLSSSSSVTITVDKVYEVGQSHDTELCDCPDGKAGHWIYRRSKTATTGFWGCPNWSMTYKGCGSLNERAMKQRMIKAVLTTTCMSQSIVQTRSFWQPMIFYPPIQPGSSDKGTIATIKEPTPTLYEQKAMQWISRYLENQGYLDAHHMPMHHQTNGLWSDSFLMVHFQSAAVRHYNHYDMTVQVGVKRYRVHIQPLWFMEWLAIELVGFGGTEHQGWLYGDADVIMFQLGHSDASNPNGRWLTVDMHKLRQWVHNRNFQTRDDVVAKTWSPRTHMTTNLPEQFETDFDMPEHQPFNVTLKDVDTTKIYRGSLANPHLDDQYIFIHVSRIEALMSEMVCDFGC